MSDTTYFDILGDWSPSPACVRRDTSLLPTTRLVFEELLSHARLLKGRRVVYPGTQRIADHLGLSTATVKRAFGQLSKKGIIKRQRRSNTSSLTTMIPLALVYDDKDIYTSASEEVSTIGSETSTNGSPVTRHNGSKSTRKVVVVEAVVEKQPVKDAKRIFVDSVIENWNEFAEKHGFRQSKGKSGIRRKISARFKEEEWQGDYWPPMLRMLTNLKSCADGSGSWKIDLDFLVKNDENADKLLGGKYSILKTAPPPKPRMTEEEAKAVAAKEAERVAKMREEERLVQEESRRNAEEYKKRQEEEKRRESDSEGEEECLLF